MNQYSEVTPDHFSPPPQVQGPYVARVQAGPHGPGLIFGQTVIHDPEDPWGQARAWITSALGPEGGQRPGLAVIFGLGLGYHLELLRRQYPEIRFLVFEPTPELLNVFEHHSVFKGSNLELNTDWADLELALSREVVYSRGGRAVVLAPEGYRELRPEAYQAFSQLVGREILRHSVIERTREDLNSLFLENLAANAGRLMGLPDLMHLKGRLPARPAFIVGAGPSLDQSAEFLRPVGAKGLILAAATALKPLLAKGVSPDVVLALEASDTSDYLRLSPAESEILGPGCLLALASSSHPAHFEVPGFHRGVFHLTAGVAEALGTGAFLPQGGNAGSAAFALAYVWGLRPLILVGQDQAYQGGRLHADRAPGQAVENDPRTIAVQGVGDSVVETHSGLLASLGWFSEAAKTIALTGQPPQLFNCSAGGARISGFIEAPLSTLVAALAPVRARLDLPGVLPRLPLPSRKEVAADLAQFAGIVDSLRRLARMDHRKARAELKNFGRVSQFLGQLLLAAEAAENKAELIAALDRADGLISLTAASAAAGGPGGGRLARA
ncbi:MAG: DUF115 domain-containing protein [Candidatus Adiutrix sp.]|jgi:hypothetical protein|nr:DUF115 domain-containing protein [Candidatus Adiutrix sp.]